MFQQAVAVAFTAMLILGVIVAVVGLAARTDPRRQPTQAPRKPPVGPIVEDDSPRDAIPAGYPGYRGSIRYIPFTNDSTEED